MTNRRVHLRSGAVFLWSALAFFLGRELIAWRQTRRLARLPRRRLLVFLFHKSMTPNSVRYGVLFGFGATFLLELLVRLFVQPLVRHWHAPRTDDSAGLFHVAANEWVVSSSPARRAAGRQW